MNFRLTAIFFGLAAVLVAGLLVAVLTEDAEPVAGAGLVPTLSASGLKAKDVDAVEIVRTQPADGKLVLVKVGDSKWEAREPVTAKVDGFLVDSLVRDLFRADPVAHAGRTDNPAVHGLDKPTVRVTLKSGADKQATVNVGDTTLGDADAVTYVATGDRPNKPLAVKRGDLAGLFRDAASGKDGAAWQLARWLPDFRGKKPLGADVRDAATDVDAVKITAGGKELALKRATGGVWTFTAPAGYGEADVAGDAAPNAKLFTGVRPLLNALTGLTVASADDFLEQPGDLAQYGLRPEDPGVIRVELLAKGAKTPEVLFVGKPVEADGKPVSPPQVYVRVDGDPAVIKVPFDRADMIQQTVADPSELRNKDLFAASARDRIDALDVTVGGATVKLRKLPVPDEREPKWVLYGGPGDPQLAEQTVVTGLVNDLTRPRVVKDILPAPNEAAFVAPEQKATLKVWVDGVEPAGKADAGKLPAEPKLLGNPTELLFGKRETDVVLVRKTAPGVAATDLKLPDTFVAQVTRPRLEYIDPKLKSFVVTNATKLGFNRGAEPVEVVKADKPEPLYPEGKWLFAAPPALKDKPADAGKVLDLLGVLATLSPGRVVADQPSADDLKKWGLDPAAPRMKASVALKDGPDKELVYEFGNDTDDKAFVYARQGGRPVVFTVPKVVFDRFATEDLRDKTIYRLDVAKLKFVRLRGWKGLTGAPLTYEFEKKDGTWAAKSPPTPAGFVVDPAKLNALLTAASAPKAIQTVSAGAKPEHGVLVDQNPTGLEITLEPEGGPAVTLVLGSAAGADTVYAASSAVPGEVFTFNPGPLKPFTEKPATLQK